MKSEKGFTNSSKSAKETVTLKGKESCPLTFYAKHSVREMQIYILNSRFKEYPSRNIYILLSKTQSVFFSLGDWHESFYGYDVRLS